MKNLEQITKSRYDVSFKMRASPMRILHCVRETSGKSVKLIGSGKKRTLSRDRRNNRGSHLPIGGLKDASSHWESRLTAVPEVVSEMRQSQRNTTHRIMWEESREWEFCFIAAFVSHPEREHWIRSMNRSDDPEVGQSILVPRERSYLFFFYVVFFLSLLCCLNKLD